MSALVLGIDPGLSGAIAAYRVDGRLSLHDIPTVTLARGKKERSEIDPAALAQVLRDVVPAGLAVEAFVEQVGAMPGQGVTSMFSFGMSYGLIRGVLAALAIPVTLVRPDQWKKALRVPAAKDGAVARASEMFPASAALFRGPRGGALDGRAEAALIALWGRRYTEAQFKELLS